LLTDVLAFEIVEQEVRGQFDHCQLGDGQEGGTFSCSSTGLPPMGAARKVRSTPPWDQTSSQPQAGQRKRSRGLAMRKSTWPSSKR
jgi:hypothetical protein